MANQIFTIEMIDRLNDLVVIEEDQGYHTACIVPRKKLSSFYKLPYSTNSGIYFLLDNKLLNT